MRKGDEIESLQSLFFHKKNLPVLISSKVLREIGAGQVDLAYMQKKDNWVLTLVEVKASSYPSSKQLQRLRKSQDYLSKVLECETILSVKFCQKDFDSLS
jgi:hypothetical protein